jgi:hypothetical protein
MNIRVATAAVVTSFVLMTVTPARAHVGSPDVFVDGHAGPHHVYVTVRPPHAIPGVADVEVLTIGEGVRRVRIVPLPLTGAGAQFAPIPDDASRSADDPKLFTGHLWMMTAGAWQVRVTVDGDAGSGVLAVPVPTLPQATLAMDRPLQLVLLVLMLVLAAGLVAIVSAIAREARLDVGVRPDQRARRRGRIAAVMATCAVVVIVYLGDTWWKAEASNYSRYVYKPLEADTRVIDSSRLALTLRDPGWIATRRTDDFVPDHGHVMHLFIVSPALDRFWHLHPTEAGVGAFEQQLPDMPHGRYEIFADVVHATGVSETVVSTIDAPDVRGIPLSGDDSAYMAGTDAVHESDDTRIEWIRDNAPLTPKRLTMFTFRVEDGAGRPVNDLELYMGMPGHAVFVRRDRRVFAHVHPSGSAPMAALEIGARSLAPAAAASPHAHRPGVLPADVTFPYGFPEAGEYRIFVQVKRAGRVVTGVFDATVH